MAWERWAMGDESTIISLFKVVCSIIFFLSLFIIPAVYWDSKQPSFTLKKSEWSCTKSHKEARTSTTLLGGKVPITQSYEVEVCDEYTRRSTE